MSSRDDKAMRSRDDKVSTEQAEPLAAGRDIHVHFARRSLLGRNSAPVRALNGVDLEVFRGETVGLVGESGCGKSTLGRVMLLLQKATRGQVIFENRDVANLHRSELRAVRPHMQLVHQDPYSSFDPRKPIGFSLREPLDIHEVGDRGSRGERVRQLIADVGLNERHLDRLPHELSGGQLQRVSIARAFALSPKLIVLDEAVSALDVSVRAQILNLLVKLRSEHGSSYLFISHDLGVVRHIAQRVVVMYLGQVMEIAPKERFFSGPAHPYSQALLSAVPIADPVHERHRERIVLAGELPDPDNPVSGCPFHPRCFVRQALGNPERCVTETPALQQVASKHTVACHFAEQSADR